MVNQLDYDVWRRNFGRTIPSAGIGSTSPAVPEPTSLIPALFAGCCCFGRIAAAARRRPE
jgi:hypothetical protein